MVSQKLQGLYLELRGLRRSLSSPEIPSEPQVPTEGGVVFKLHYFQVETAPTVCLVS